MDKKDMADEGIEQLELESVLERQVDQLSGGELQRFICGLTCVQNVDIYMFDEPSSYLDVKQRLNAARMIRKMLAPQKYVIVVEHDLSVLDYLSDYICCLYGTPGAYGVVTMPFSVREGINIFSNADKFDIQMNSKLDFHGPSATKTTTSREVPTRQPIFLKPPLDLNPNFTFI